MSDDEAPIAKKSTKLKKLVRANDDDDEAPIAKPSKVKKAASKPLDDDEDDAGGAITDAVSAAMHADPTAPLPSIADGTNADAPGASSPDGAVEVVVFPHVDYDSMSYDDFLKHLQTVTKAQRYEQWRRHEESLASHEHVEGLEGDEQQGFTDSSGGYTYNFLLQRVMEMMPRQDGASEVKIPAPQLERMGSKRTVIVNFDQICKHLNRDAEDVKDFIEKQLTIASSIDANGCWVGRVQNVRSSQVENIFQKYISQYVQCQMCWSIDTQLTKDVGSRLTYLTCKMCGASRTVSAVASASYKAQTVKRSRLRAQKVS